MKHSWKRFWYPRGAPLATGEEGFLLDPDAEYGKFLNPGALSFDKIADSPCLVLLGEPGTGKSHELHATVQARRRASEEEDFLVISRDLGSYSTDAELSQDIFRHPDFADWLRGDRTLELFLDSLDESMLHIETVARRLGSELQRYADQKDRLRLRIACRTAVWPSTLEARLVKIWHGSETQVCLLAPLRRVDIAVAAADSGLDADAFIEAVLRQGVGPFAVKPVTLNMLLGTFAEQGDLPRSQCELYERGCLYLCEEMNPERRESGAGGQFGAVERLAAATRIAAATVFSNRRSVWLGEDALAPPQGTVPVGALCGGSEPAGEGTIEVTRDLILETLRDTGLFTSHGQSVVTWGHQTYAEYLAARYLHVNRLDDRQVLSLLTHPQDIRDRVAPQLQETAGWASCTRENLFDHILTQDPELLLLSDMGSASDSRRQQLVDVLLRGYEEESLHFRWNIRPFRKLAHPGLAEQLRAYIADSSKPAVARLTAVCMAEEAGVTSLAPMLAERALDENEHHDIRVAAARAVAACGNEVTKARMKPLALGQAGVAPGNRLRGAGLQAAWPNHLSAGELFDSLVDPASGDSWAYSSFVKELKEDLRRQLLPEDLPAALGWVGRTAPQHHRHGDFAELRSGVMRYAWDELRAHPDLVTPYAEAAVACLAEHEGIFRGDGDESYLDTDQDRRRQVLAQAIEVVAKSKGENERLRFYRLMVLLRSQDLVWILDQFPGMAPEFQEAWAELIRYILPRDSSDDLSRLLRTANQYAMLFEKIPNLNPVQLDSEDARRMRRNHHRQRRGEQRKTAYENRMRRRREECFKQLDQLLEEALAEQPDAWWKANVWMLSACDGVGRPESEWDLTASEYWKEADEPRRSEILAVAKSYLRAEHDWQTDWAGTDTTFRPAYAAYRSLRLLQSQEPDSLADIPEERWRDLVPVVLAYPLYNGEESKEPHSSLVGHVYELWPEDLAQWVRELIDRRAQAHWVHETIHQLEACLDERLCNLLLEKARDQAIGREHRMTLLGFLLDRDFGPAMDYCLSLVPERPPKEGESREMARRAAMLVMRHGHEGDWSRVWNFANSDPESGKWLFREAMDRSGEGRRSLLSLLSGGQLADLYLWLQEHLPPRASEGLGDGSPARKYDGIRFLRNGIINSLAERGEVPALRSLQRELPEAAWLARVMAEAEEIHLRDSWEPPIPAEIVRLSRDQTRRLVENGRQLLDLLLESLQRYQQRLQGEGASVWNLWDNQGMQTKPAWRPKSENHLSNNVANHLRHDLTDQQIVVNREVEIRPGEETDVHVTAFKRGRNGEGVEPITAIIETKGCWDGDLDQAMETQLVGKYLRENACPYGVYLVGWFDCDRWTGDHPARSACPPYRIEDARRRFDEQASSISRGDAATHLDVRAYVLDARLR